MEKHSNNNLKYAEKNYIDSDDKALTFFFIFTLYDEY